MTYSSFCRRSVAGFALALIGSTAAQAVSYTTSVTIGYDPNAPTSNFATPGTTNSETAYTVRTGIDDTNFYVDVTASPPSAQPVDQFANVYFGGATFNPGLIFEVTNNQVYTTADQTHAYSLANTGFTFNTATNDISFALPLSFLRDDPLGIGFTKVNTGDEIRVSYTQAFGYSFVGGTANYGSARLGEQFVPAPAAGAVPEPSSWALMLIGFGAIGATMRRRRISVGLA